MDQGKARIRPSMSYVCRIRSTAGGGSKPEDEGEQRESVERLGEYIQHRVQHRRRHLQGYLAHEKEQYRGTSMIRSSAPLGPYSRTTPRALWWPWVGGLFLMGSRGAAGGVDAVSVKSARAVAVAAHHTRISHNVFIIQV